MLGPHKILNLLSDGTGSPMLKPDETHIHCAIYVCVFIIFFFNFLVRKAFVCDCMGPEDHEIPCLPQTSDCTEVTQTEIINCKTD